MSLCVLCGGVSCFLMPYDKECGGKNDVSQDALTGCPLSIYFPYSVPYLVQSVPYKSHISIPLHQNIFLAFKNCPLFEEIMPKMPENRKIVPNFPVLPRRMHSFSCFYRANSEFFPYFFPPPRRGGGGADGQNIYR